MHDNPPARRRRVNKILIHSEFIELSRCRNDALSSARRSARGSWILRIIPAAVRPRRMLHVRPEKRQRFIETAAFTGFKSNLQECLGFPRR